MNLSEREKNIIKKTFDSISKSYQTTKKHSSDATRFRKRSKEHDKLRKQAQKALDKTKFWKLKQKATLKTKLARHSKVRSDFNKLKSNLSTKKAMNTGFSKGIKGAVIATGAATIATLAYKRYMSKVAKACKGKKGIERKECIKSYKTRAPKVKKEDAAVVAGSIIGAKIARKGNRTKGAIIGGISGSAAKFSVKQVHKMFIRKKCKNQYPDDQDRQLKCIQIQT